MRRERLWWAVCLSAALVWTGCGDDDGGGGGTDAGPEEDSGSGETDAGTEMDAGGGGMDAGMDAGGPDQPLTECDPFAEDTGCADDEKCSVAIYPIDDMTNAVMFGCVPRSLGEKGADVLCGRFGSDATPDDTTDMVRTDDCAEGTFCWIDGALNRCQPLCGDDRVECETSEYCGILNSEPRFGTCQLADDCDPVYQTGCDSDEGCYLVSNTMGDLLGSCFEFGPPDGGTGAPGDDCMFINDCAPGSQCFPEYFPDGGASEAVSCKTLCNSDTTVDGGVPTDGGPSGECETADTCTAIPLDEGSAMVLTPPGVCL